VGDPSAESAVLVRVAEEVDDLAELVLRVLDAGDVRERDLVAGGLVSARRPWMRTTGVLPEAFAAPISSRSRSEMDAMPVLLSVRRRAARTVRARRSCVPVSAVL
jgi:hypothetical protein